MNARKHGGRCAEVRAFQALLAELGRESKELDRIISNSWECYKVTPG